MRVGAREAIDTVEQPAAREGADDANGQHLAQMTPGIKIERRPDPLKSIRHHGHKSLPPVRQGKAARQAAEQSRSQTALDRTRAEQGKRVSGRVDLGGTSNS